MSTVPEPGKVRILGIDPGSRVTGYGIVELSRGRLRYVASGCVRPSATDLGSRLRIIGQGVRQVVETWQPQQAAIEQVFMARNPDSALKLGQARGVAIFAMAEQGLTVAEYAARTIKQALVGRGSADKRQVQAMVMHLLQLVTAPQTDASDALAVAICHAHSDGLLAAGAASGYRNGRMQ